MQRSLISLLNATCCLLVGSLLLGCQTDKTPEVEHTPAVEWRTPDVPPATIVELERIRARLPDSLEPLVDDIQSRDRRAKLRAIGTLERLGKRAGEAAPTIFKALEKEDDPVTVAMLVRAAAALPSSEDGVRALRRRYREEPNPILKTYLSGAIVVTDNPADSQVELQYLIDSLDPYPPRDLSIDGLQAFWEQRWAAAYMVGKMGSDGAPLIPVLERCLEAEKVPVWVSRQVLFAQREVGRQ
jgi:HEAT repeat protein